MAVEPDDDRVSYRDRSYMDHMGSAGGDLLHGVVGT